MPCNSDYMNPTDLEVRISQTLCLLDELKTGKPVNRNSSAWHGYHDKAYGKELYRKDADKIVAELCEKLSKVKDITKHSLEMQLWWREHKEADSKRLAEEKKAKQEKKSLTTLLDKLSPREIQLLKKHGLEVE